MHPSARAKRLGNAKISILESVTLLAADIQASEKLLNRMLKPKGQGDDQFCNQLEAIAELLVEVTYATGVQDRPVDEPEEDTPKEPRQEEVKELDKKPVRKTKRASKPKRTAKKTSRAARKAKRTSR